MENSNLNDSQVLIPSSLDSPSSEPADIRNWFSSYVYESPVLDSNDNFGDSMSREREIEENEAIGGNFCEFRDVAKIDEEEAADKLPRSWIPLKCTSLEDLRGSQPLAMNQDSWCSQSLLSEPPDVGNWFSSYVYESPTLNPSQEFGSWESENNGLGNQIEQTLANVRETKNEGEGVQLNPFVKCNGNSNGNRQENRPLSEPNLSSKRTLEQEPKEKSLGTKGISPTKDVQISSLTTEGPQCKLQNKVPQENGSAFLHINGSSDDDSRKKLPTHKNLIHKTDLMLGSSESEVQTQLDGSTTGNYVPSVLTNEQSTRKQMDQSNNKENKGKRVSENGFVTASKHEFSEVTCKKPVERQENYFNKGTGSAFDCRRRKAFSDKTNIVHSDIVEVIGKWSCPQKSKPNLGPPLKQLRLERWVHKE